MNECCRWQSTQELTLVPYSEQRILSVQKWSEKLFTLTSTRPDELQFEDGEFLTIGLRPEGKLIARAYSIVSTNAADHLEFLSIYVPDGPLTRHLVRVQPGNPIWVNTKATGTLTLKHVLPGRAVYMLATGTGIAPFICLVRGGNVFKQFERVVLVHTVRQIEDLVYREELQDLAEGKLAGKFTYVPTVTREPFATVGRGSALFESGALFAHCGMPPADPDLDRVMLCGNPAMNKEMTAFLKARGWTATNHAGIGNFTVEKAFVMTHA